MVEKLYYNWCITCEQDTLNCINYPELFNLVFRLDEKKKFSVSVKKIYFSASLIVMTSYTIHFRQPMPTKVETRVYLVGLVCTCPCHLTSLPKPVRSFPLGRVNPEAWPVSTARLYAKPSVMTSRLALVKVLVLIHFNLHHRKNIVCVWECV